MCVQSRAIATVYIYNTRPLENLTKHSQLGKNQFQTEPIWQVQQKQNTKIEFSTGGISKPEKKKPD